MTTLYIEMFIKVSQYEYSSSAILSESIAVQTAE